MPLRSIQKMSASSRRILLTAAGMVLVTALIYSNSLTGPFIFDDGHAIVDNPAVRTPFSFEKILSPGPPGPVVNLTLFLNYAVGGLDVVGYHIFNIAVHILAGLVLFGIIRRTLIICGFGSGSLGPAGVAALLWLVHPLQTESVTYIIQRYETLAALCYLLTLYFFIRAAFSSRRLWWSAGACLFSALGMAAKEITVTLPVLVLIYDRIFLSGSFRRAFRRRRIFYPCLAATWLVLLLIVINKPYAAWGGFSYREISPIRYALNQPPVIAHYLLLSIRPYPLCLDYGWPPAENFVSLLPGLLVIGSLLALTVIALIKKPPAGFLGVWFFLTLAPTSSLIPICDLAFEHRMYLPLAAVTAGGSIGVFLSLRRLFPNSAVFRKAIGYVLLLGAVLFLGALTFRRNRDYQSAVGIWSKTVTLSPANPRAHYNLGNALRTEGRIEESIRPYRRATRLNPAYADAFYNLGLSLEETGRSRPALAAYFRSHELNPNSVKTLNNLGGLLSERGRGEEALEYFRAALELDTGHAAARTNLANLQAVRGDYRTAVKNFRRVLKQDPSFSEAHYNLAVTLERLADRAGAKSHYHRALELDPDKAEAHYNLGLLLFEEEEFPRAAACFRKALILDPEFRSAARALEKVKSPPGVRNTSGGRDRVR